MQHVTNQRPGDSAVTVEAHRPRRGRRLVRRVAAVSVGVLALGGVAVAADAVTTAAPVIHACYSPSTGSIRMATGPANACPAGMKRVAWNQTGPRGVAGAKGATGPMGATGATGPQGAKGDTGAAGSSVGWAVVSSTGTTYSHGGTLDAPTITHPATGVYCITGTGWVQQGGPYSVTLVNSGSGGEVALNPYFWGSVCNPTGYFVAVHTFNSTGVATDSYFTIAKLG